MTKNRIGLIAVSLLSLTALASCTRTVDEIHSAGQYDTALFENNYLLDIHDYSSPTLLGTTTLDGTTNVFFGQNDPTGVNISAKHDVQDDSLYGGRYSSIFTYNDAKLEDSTIVRTEGDNLSKYVGTDFGATKSLERADSAFKYGVLSKLYNGQTKCFGTGTKQRVQIDKKGFDSKLPKTAASGDYFLVSFRGASDFGVGVHWTTIDLSLRLYKGSEYQEFVMQNVVAGTDGTGELVSYVGFKMSDFGYSFEGTDGYGISYTLKADSKPELLANENSDASVTSSNHYALMLYEVMFPDSTWR